MAQVLFPGARFTNTDGEIISGGKLYVYEAGTTTPLDVYTDSALSSAADNPVVLDSAGLMPVRYASPDEYKVVLKSSDDGTTYWTIDNLTVTDPSPTSVATRTATSKTTDFTLTSADVGTLFRCDTSGGGINITAPATTLGNGFWCTIQKTDANNSVVINPSGGETINGESSYTLTNDLDTVDIVSLGATGWAVVASNEALTYASAAQIRNGSSSVAISPSGLESAAAEVTLTDAATVAVDWDSGINFTVTLGGNRALGFPTNIQTGTWRRISIVQDGTGSRTMTFTASGYYAAGGSAPSLSTGAGDVDVIYLYARSSSIVEIYSGGLDWTQIS